MPTEFLYSLPFLLGAVGAGLLGGVIALFWKPPVKARSAIQHFAAGAVLAAVAGKVVPEVERTGTIPGILGSFALGGLAMIGLKYAVVRYERSERSERRRQAPPKLPAGLAAAAAVDTLLDGAIISAGFHSGDQLGTLLALTLAVELAFLNLSVGGEVRKGRTSRWVSLAITTGISACLLIGAFSAALLLRDASETQVAWVLAFGAAALIYLIAEELLVEAIEAEHSLFSTAMLFAGFLTLLALNLMSTPPQGQ